MFAYAGLLMYLGSKYVLRFISLATKSEFLNPKMDVVAHPTNLAFVPETKSPRPSSVTK